MGSIHIRLGNIFDNASDLVLLPCSAKGTFTNAAREHQTRFQIPPPKPTALGEIQIVPFAGSGVITRRATSHPDATLVIYCLHNDVVEQLKRTLPSCGVSQQPAEENQNTGAWQFDVFLSHSAKDKTVVRELAARLQQDGVRVWLDEWEIKPGDSIPAKIEEGLEHSRVLVLCMSTNAFGSDWSKLEGYTFSFRDPLNKQRRFIPLRLDEAPIKGSLEQFLYVDWRPAERGREYPKLIAACRRPETWLQPTSDAQLPKPPEPQMPGTPGSQHGELIGKHRMELAEEALALSYQAREIIGSARSFLVHSSECATRKAAPDETPEQKRIRDEAFVTLDRLNRASETFKQIDALRCRFKAQFGPDMIAPFDELMSILGRLHVSAHQWVMLSEVKERNFTSPQSLQEHRARIQKHEDILWGAEKDDPICSRLDTAVADMERICRPHIDRMA